VGKRRVPWKVAGWLVLLQLCAASALVAEGGLPKPVYRTFVDWAADRVTIDATVDVSAIGSMLPDARQKAIQLINDDRTMMMDQALFPIVADSYHTVGDLAAASPRALTALQELVQPQNQVYAKMSTDLNAFTVRYRFPIFPNLGRIFVNQVKANPPSPLLSYVPTTKFSGIVIYAKGKLPVHGENQTAELVPSLFPRIWGANMDLLASADTVGPEVLRTRGMVAYSDNTDETPFTARIGLTPLRTVAVGLFGKHPTDVIISTQAADRILASPENIRLLTEGRILIIADIPQSGVTPAS